MSAASDWEAKRREVIERFSNACAHCGIYGGKLNVHHRYYEAGKRPHEYPIETLILLCDRCHGREDELRRRIVRATGFLGNATTVQATAYMEALAAMDSVFNAPGAALVNVDGWWAARGVSDATGIPVEQIEAAARVNGGKFDVGGARR